MLALGRNQTAAPPTDSNTDADAVMEIWAYILGKIAKQGGPFAGFGGIRFCFNRLFIFSKAVRRSA